MAGDVLNVDHNATIHLEGVLKMTTDIIGSQLNTFGGTIQFIGDNSIGRNSNVVFNSNLIGSATIFMAGNQGGGVSVEVNGLVGPGLTFKFNDGVSELNLQIDHPKEFLGQIDLPSTPLGGVTFMGLHATSADLHDDMLLMFNGRRLVDTVQVVGGTDFQLRQNTTGVVPTDGHEGSGTVIPLHIGSPPTIFTH